MTPTFSGIRDLSMTPTFSSVKKLPKTLSFKHHNLSQDTDQFEIFIFIIHLAKTPILKINYLEQCVKL